MFNQLHHIRLIQQQQQQQQRLKLSIKSKKKKIIEIACNMRLELQSDTGNMASSFARKLRITLLSLSPFPSFAFPLSPKAEEECVPFDHGVRIIPASFGVQAFVIQDSYYV